MREELDSVENKIDQVLAISTRTDQEHQVTQARVDIHDKRLRKIEQKIGIPSPTSSAFA